MGGEGGGLQSPAPAHTQIKQSISQQSTPIESLQIQEVPTSYMPKFLPQTFVFSLQNIKVIQEILKFCYSYDWIQQLFYFLTLQVWYLGAFLRLGMEVFPEVL